MDTELKNKLEIIEQKVDRANKDLKTIKRVFLWTFIITVLVIVVPMIALYFVIPSFMSSLGGLGGVGGNSADYNALLKSLGL